MQRKAQEAQIPDDEQEKMLRNLEKRETEFMRLQRHKVGIDDFELLTVIGKGAFGEVRCLFYNSIFSIIHVFMMQIYSKRWLEPIVLL